jgi:hypothetical protein
MMANPATGSSDDIKGPSSRGNPTPVVIAHLDGDPATPMPRQSGNPVHTPGNLGTVPEEKMTPGHIYGTIQPIPQPGTGRILVYLDRQAEANMLSAYWEGENDGRARVGATPPVTLQATVTRLVPRVISQLTDDDAVCDGFRDRPGRHQAGRTLSPRGHRDEKPSHAGSGNAELAAKVNLGQGGAASRGKAAAREVEPSD